MALSARLPAERRVSALSSATDRLGAGVGALLVCAAVLVPSGLGQVAWLPLLGGLLIGLPHGAADHLGPPGCWAAACPRGRSPHC